MLFCPPIGSPGNRSKLVSRSGGRLLAFHAPGAGGAAVRRRCLWDPTKGHVSMVPRRPGMTRHALAGVALTLAALFVAGVPAQGAVFSDIQGDPNQRGIEKLAIAGVLAGFPDGTYKPDPPFPR